MQSQDKLSESQYQLLSSELANSLAKELSEALEPVKRKLEEVHLAVSNLEDNCSQLMTEQTLDQEEEED